MLLLSEEDIEKSLSMEEAINVIEEAFLKYANNDFVMPARNFSKVKDEDTLLIMPCFVDDCIGLKVVTSYPSNNTTNSPVTQGLVLLNNRETGDPLAIINGTVLTTIKTAAVAGVAMRFFMKEAETVGLIGTGLQGMYQLLAAISSTSVKTIYIFNRSSEKMERFIQEFRTISKSDIEIIPVLDKTELIRNSQIIITATTSVSPVLPDESGIYEKKLIVGVGSYKSNMRELPQSLFESLDYYYIDSEQGKIECGDIIDPLKEGWVKESQIVLLSDMLKGRLKVTQHKNPIVFKTVSMALFDAYIGNYVFKKAKELGIGQELKL
ncbi:ornithine cyclodeaminase family protein [Alkalihalobacillus deserti]|uniref:ornithine cyclodeaminase family protein n=1 Tax=Alkalihalobacillus deserti TaxID=2879466 RepID=UPI001D15670D|nr:ornithine cyclodeaminase family protein [Alkalihalobacillus deserti]